jgi:hypothetical protein
MTGSRASNNNVMNTLRMMEQNSAATACLFREDYHAQANGTATRKSSRIHARLRGQHGHRIGDPEFTFLRPIRYKWNMKIFQGMTLILVGVLITAAAEGDSGDPLFQDQSTLKVEISAPLSTLIRNRSEEEDLPGVVSFKDTGGTLVELDVQVTTRGNFRRKNCDFPPVTLNFKKSQVGGTLFDQQNKLKLVAHCKITGQYEQSVIREYLAYRMLNVLTDLSFRVRLLQVTWVDSDERRGRMVRHAFLIEHKNRLEARTGLEEQEVAFAELSVVRPDHLNLASMFQFLIGNFDFSPTSGSGGECCHNYAMFGSGPDSLVAIPYDFDFAGIVNAPNAVPNADQGVERIGQRVYQGYCENNHQIEASISEFQKTRETIYAQVANQDGLEPSVRESVTAYIDDFYKIVNDPVALEREVISQCR